MNILAVDDDKYALKLLTQSIETAVSGVCLMAFTDPGEALGKVHSGGFMPEVAFVDIALGPVDGLDFSRELLAVAPDTDIIIVTGYASYALDAFKLRASGYILKPATPEKVRLELDNLRSRRRPPATPRTGALLSVSTFGSFEVTAGGRPLHFSRSRSKETFAYLVDRRGASVTMAELAGALWEGEPYTRSRQNQVQTFVSDMLKTLREAGAEGAVKRSRNSLAVDPDKLDCDCYGLIKGERAACEAFAGEYMTDYAWAEETAAELQQLVRDT